MITSFIYDNSFTMNLSNYQIGNQIEKIKFLK